MAGFAVRVILPLKPLDEAKGRLAGVLGAPDRRKLVLAMLADVLAAAHAAGLDDLAVLSRDPEALACAEALGVRPLAERPPARSLNSALSRALAAAGDAGTAVLIV